MKTNKLSKSISLRIVLIPGKKLTSDVVKIATKGAKLHETYYKVDGKKYIVHLTVYLGTFPVEIKPKVFEVLEKIIEKYKAIILQSDGLDILEEYLWLKFKLKGDLKRLHGDILNSLKSLGKVHKYNTAKNYQPHISLLVYKNRSFDKKSLLKKLQFKKLNFDSNWKYLAVAEDEEHGTVTKILKKYKLKT